MRLGGLFSGIGGFELAWQKAGGEVAWMCEVDKHARKVLEARFPGVPVYEDVRELDPAVVEPVDVLTGGSPCQGFSIAGSRSGLEHGESRLFADYIRIMEGLAARGLKWAVWENVPGVLSIKDKDTGERTFEHVVGALAGAGEPVRLDPKRKWNAGVVGRDGRAVAWRVVDSRHFGVSQRRRRVYAAVAFGGAAVGRAGRAVLAVSEGVRRDPPACVTKGQGAAAGVRERFGGEGVAPTVTSKWAKGTGGPAGDETQNLTLQKFPELTGTLGAKGSGGIDDLDRMTFIPDQPQALNWQSGGDMRGLDPSDNTSPLTTQQTPAVLMTMREGKPGGGKGPLLATEESLTLATGNGQTLFDPVAFRKSKRAQSDTDDETWVQDGNANTLNVFDAGDTRTTHAIVEPSPYGVRRLTPVECERLQAFPDGWTEPAGSDSARYRALGNAVTVNVPLWLFGRMMEL